MYTQEHTLDHTPLQRDTHTACMYICCFKSNGITVNIFSLLIVKYKSVCPQITCKYRYDFPNCMFNVITLVFRCRTAIAYSCFVTVRDRVILFKSALKHMFEECLLDYLAKTIVFISWTACGIIKKKKIYFLVKWLSNVQ